MLQVRTTTRFRRDVKRVRKQGRDLQILQTVMNEIASGNPLAPRFRDHVLRGNYKGRRECHLAPDWLLIYRTTQTEAVFERTGSHAELFK
jgi:mRNA interferase YafQ